MHSFLERHDTLLAVLNANVKVGINYESIFSESNL